ncbi:MAG: hypothetical protein QXW97_03935 [Candidatus Pacearchaeota archaeon]
MLLREMKNLKECNHKKIALEKIKMLELKKSFKLNKLDFDNLDGKIQEVILCLECGKELQRS